MSNSLDPDEARRFVGPDLGPKFCQCYQQTTLVDKKLKTEVLLWKGRQQSMTAMQSTNDDQKTFLKNIDIGHNLQS